MTAAFVELMAIIHNGIFTGRRLAADWLDTILLRIPT
jgi:hypothetical protein